MAAKGPPVEVSWPGKREAPRRLEAGPDALRPLEHHGAPTPAPAQRELWDPATEPNLLVRGDNLLALAALEGRFAQKAQLIYIDPPYATGLSYYAQTEGGDRRAYRDQFEDGLAGYLAMMRDRLAALRRFLTDDGVLFLHCDWRANSALRLLLDELFGPSCHRNEIIWRRAPNLGRQAASKQLGRVYDSILVYSRHPGSRMVGEAPRRRAEVEYDGKGKPKGARWDEAAEAYFTTAPRGDYTDASIERLRGENRVYESSSGKVYIKYFLTPGPGGRWFKEQPVDALWDDHAVRPLRHRPKAEAMGYDTQKPEGLLERIIGWATRPGDLVVDAFCGSGTTLAVAERMNRRWLGIDGGAHAIGICRRRLWSLDARPFTVASVEDEEWRRWVETLAPDEDARAVLQAWGATPTEGRFGEKEGAPIWVAPLGRPLTEVPAVRPLLVLAGSAIEAPDDVAVEHVSIEMARRAVRGGTLASFPRRALTVAIRRDGHFTVALTEPDATVTGWMVDFAASGPFRPVWQVHQTYAERALPWESPPLAAPADVTTIRVKVLFADGTEALTSAAV